MITMSSVYKDILFMSILKMNILLLDWLHWFRSISISISICTDRWLSIPRQPFFNFSMTSRIEQKRFQVAKYGMELLLLCEVKVKQRIITVAVHISFVSNPNNCVKMGSDGVYGGQGTKRRSVVGVDFDTHHFIN